MENSLAHSLDLFPFISFYYFALSNQQRVILHTIGFELSIDHPYTFLVEQIGKLVNGKKVEYKHPPSAPSTTIMSKMKNELTQYAMNFTNDSMQTSLCLQFPPQQIAASMVYLSALFCKIQPTGGKDWTEILEHLGDVASFASICLQVIELLMDRKGAHKETFDKIRLEITKLRDNYAGEGPPAKRSRTN